MDLEEYLATFGEVEKVPLTRFQQVVGKRLSQSWQAIPHVTHHDFVDVTNLDAHRQAMDKSEQISPLLYIVKALGKALESFPEFSSSLSEDGKSLIMKRYAHVGVAIDGPLGLLVPVLRNVNSKSLAELAAELSGFTVISRDKGLPVETMSGGSITVSSLGNVGGVAFSPIVNPPEVAILGVTPMRTIAFWTGENFEPRKEMTLSLSYDHRIINGVAAAKFVRCIADLRA